MVVIDLAGKFVPLEYFFSDAVVDKTAAIESLLGGRLLFHEMLGILWQ